MNRIGESGAQRWFEKSQGGTEAANGVLKLQQSLQWQRKTPQPCRLPLNNQQLNGTRWPSKAWPGLYRRVSGSVMSLS
jgi:hypothetical protein